MVEHHIVLRAIERSTVGRTRSRGGRALHEDVPGVTNRGVDRRCRPRVAGPQVRRLIVSLARFGATFSSSRSVVAVTIPSQLRPTAARNCGNRLKTAHLAHGCPSRSSRRGSAPMSSRKPLIDHVSTRRSKEILAVLTPATRQPQRRIVLWLLAVAAVAACASVAPVRAQTVAGGPNTRAAQGPNEAQP